MLERVLPLVLPDKFGKAAAGAGAAKAAKKAPVPLVPLLRIGDQLATARLLTRYASAERRRGSSPVRKLPVLARE